MMQYDHIQKVRHWTIILEIISGTNMMQYDHIQVVVHWIIILVIISGA